MDVCSDGVVLLIGSLRLAIDAIGKRLARASCIFLMHDDWSEPWVVKALLASFGLQCGSTTGKFRAASYVASILRDWRDVRRERRMPGPHVCACPRLPG